MEIEFSGGSRTLEILAAGLVLAAVTFVLVRAALAHRRGEDAGQAAAGALKAVGPPVLLAVFGLVVLTVLAGLFGIIVILVLVSWAGGEADLGGQALLIVVAGVVIVLVTVVGAVVWGITRILRSIRARQ